MPLSFEMQEALKAARDSAAGSLLAVTVAIIPCSAQDNSRLAVLQSAEAKTGPEEVAGALPRQQDRWARDSVGDGGGMGRGFAFGYLEFDWAAGAIPGFDDWLLSKAGLNGPGTAAN